MSAIATAHLLSKGQTTIPSNVANIAIEDAQSDYHNYTLDWTQDSLTWYVDTKPVRTLSAATAGSSYPQTPMQLKIGTWAAGDSHNQPGTINWAGGQTTYSQGPFTASVQKVRVVDASQGTSYQYSGTDGSWQNVKVDKNGSSSGPSPASASASGSAAAASASNSGVPAGANAATPSAGAPLGIPTGLISSAGNSSLGVNSTTSSGSNVTATGGPPGSNSTTGSGSNTTATGGSPSSNATATGGSLPVNTKSASPSSSSPAHSGAARNLLSRSGVVGVAGAIVALGMALM